jgi:PAS domain S-box-containing protein
MKGEIGNLIHSIQTLLDQAYQQHATLAISKNHLEIILEQTDQAIAIIDPHQRLIVINTMWEARLGYSAHALRSKSLESIIPAREWSAQVHLLQTLVQPLHLLNHPYITKGGEITMIDVDFIPMESGEILMIASGMEMNAPRESSQMHPPTLVLNGTEGENTFTIQLTLEVEGGNKW